MIETMTPEQHVELIEALDQAIGASVPFDHNRLRRR